MDVTSDARANASAGADGEHGVDRPAVSVVVPTYQEAENIGELVQRISATLERLHDLYEILIVDDDSQDGTVEVVERLQAEGHPVRLIVRQGRRGLSSAVLDGFRQARGERLVCLDADLSHPPEALPAMLETLERGEAEMVVASRYAPGGSTDEGWSRYRRWNSRIATWLARPFTSIKDPMAGYFALQRDVFLRTDNWDPIGYKIALEILVKSGCRRVREVPIHFADRRRGTSKLDWRQQLAFLQHLEKLADFRFPTRWRLVKYCLVGLTGAAVDLTAFAMLLASGTALPIARAAGIVLGMSWNFCGNDQFTFRTSHLPGSAGRYLRFVVACGMGNLISFIVSVQVPAWTGLLANAPMLAAVMGIVAGTLFNFSAAHAWAFRSRPSADRRLRRGGISKRSRRDESPSLSPTTAIKPGPG